MNRLIDIHFHMMLPIIFHIWVESRMLGGNGKLIIDVLCGCCEIVLSNGQYVAVLVVRCCFRL